MERLPVILTSPEIVPPEELNFRLAVVNAPLAKLAAELAVKKAAFANVAPD